MQGINAGGHRARFAMKEDDDRTSTASTYLAATMSVDSHWVKIKYWWVGSDDGKANGDNYTGGSFAVKFEWG